MSGVFVNMLLLHCVCSAKEKDRRGHLLSLQGQRGILSCFAAHPTSPSLIAAGAFNGDGELDVAA